MSILLEGILELLFKGIGYTMILYAFWLLVGNSFYENYVKSSIRKYQVRKRIRRLQELEREVDEPKKKSPFMEKLEILLQSTSKTGNVNVTNFIMLCITIFGVTTIILLFLLKDPIFSFIVGAFLGITPYLLTIYRLEIMRLRTSLAFMNEFNVILQAYQSTNKNIYYTLLNIVENLNDKDIKRQFYKLISAFQKERHDTDFRKHVQVFMFSINSTFAKRFGNLLIKAHLENVDIGNALLTLNEDITQRKKDMEDESTEKLQTVMIGFAPIFVFPIVIFFCYQLTGVVDFWYYFKKPMSLTLFVICLICSIISILLAFLIRRPRADV